MAEIGIVDDVLSNLRMLSTILQERGHVTRCVSSGAAALRTIQADPPDLILLDIRMPGIDGYEVCDCLKRNERTRDIPIIFISALDSTEDKVKAFEAGGVDYIAKPFQEAEVVARVEAHLELRAMRRRLEAEIAELDAFAHTVAHDLLDPMGTLTGFATVLERDYASMTEAERVECIRHIGRIGRKTTNIVHELLMLSTVRKEAVQLQALSMGDIVAAALESLADLIQQNGAEIVISDHQWLAVKGHAPWVEEVWVNYIGNAIKYGGTPTAKPRVELGSALDADGMIRFWVRDNGRGLVASEQEYLFTEFTRLSQVRARGHGLGLSIVKRIVEKLGGQVGVESEGIVGKGSTFWFTLQAV
ncbi:MAG: hybrid sensor histidine kinase/response regulator [Thermoflexales bacterium]|nr:hybrid sensor histidine kinase/response regulator [Thermoflexales bacterium]